MPEKLGYNVHKHNPYRRLTGKSCGRMYKTGGFAMLSGGKYAEEYAQADKARESKVRTRMYDT